MYRCDLKKKTGRQPHIGEGYIAPLGCSNGVSRGYRYISASLTVSLCLVAIFSFVMYFMYVMYVYLCVDMYMLSVGA